MRNCDLLCAGVVLALSMTAVHPVAAQSFEGVGVRAQGLGGAFVAVADDATATWWNPAGIATGPYLSAVVERGRTTEPVTPLASGPAVRTTSGDFAVTFPAWGLSYYRLRISEIGAAGSTAAAAANRQDPRGTGSSVRTVSVSQYGSTVGQSIGRHLVVGTTLKLLRAGTVASHALGAEPLDDADDLDVPRQTKSDLDVGALMTAGHLRAGLTVKNLLQPTFGEDGPDALQLKRRARVGLAVLSVPHGMRQGLIAAVDADLTTATTAFGSVRHIAAGMEGWLSKGRLGVRVGASANTVDEARPAVSGGVSVSLTRSLQLTASKTLGRDETVTGWTSGINVAF